MMASLDQSDDNQVLAGIDDMQENQSNQSFKDEAIQLLSVKTDKKQDREVFELNQEALQVLRDVEGQIGVVSVCGLKGAGKSFLLNLILHKFNGTGFKVNK